MSILTGAILLWLGVTGDHLLVPDMSDSWRMAGALVVGLGAYYLIVMATRIGDMSVVAPFRYSRLVFALIVGVIVFQERPDTFTLVGALIIVGSGIYTLWRESRLRRTSLRAAKAV